MLLGLVLVVVAAAAWTCSPVLGIAWWENHDMYSYPIRLVEYVRVVKMGNLFPRWCPDMYGGLGAPFFNYYAPGVFTLGTPFVLLGISPHTTLKLVAILFSACGGVGMLLFVRRETGRLDAAFLAALVFLFTPYRYVQLLKRGDLAEYCAIALFPLALFLYRRLATVSHAKLPAGVMAAAAANAGMVMTHTLTGQWATEFLALMLAPSMVKLWKTDRTRVVAAAGAMLAACGLAAIYAVPALLERPLVQIERMLQGGLATSHNFVELGWLFKPGEFFFIGWPLIAAVPVALVLAIVHSKRRMIWPWLALSLAMLPLMLRMSEPVWSVLPFARYIQFPWRLLGFLGVFTSVLVGVVWALAVRPGRVAWITVVPLAALFCWRGAADKPAFHVQTLEQIPMSLDAIAAGVHSTVVSDEYLPREVPGAPRSQRKSLMNEESPGIRTGAIRHVGIGYRVLLTASQKGTMVLSNHWFPGWNAKLVHGPAEVKVGPSPGGLIQIELPKPGEYELLVRFGTTWPRALGSTLSALTLLLLVGLVLARRFLSGKSSRASA